MGALQANIAMDEDKKEEQKKADVDRSKLEADIKAQTDLASKVSVVTFAQSSLFLSDLSKSKLHCPFTAGQACRSCRKPVDVREAVQAL